MAVVEDALQAKLRPAALGSGLQLEHLVAGEVIAVVGRVRAGVARMEKGKQRPARFHHRAHFFDDRFHQRFGQVIGDVPAEHRVERTSLESHVLGHEAHNIQRGLAVFSSDLQRRVPRRCQNIFRVERVAATGEPRDVRRRGSAQIEHRQAFLPFQVAKKLLQPAGTPVNARARGLHGFRWLLRATPE